MAITVYQSSRRLINEGIVRESKTDDDEEDEYIREGGSAS